MQEVPTRAGDLAVPLPGLQDAIALRGNTGSLEHCAFCFPIAPVLHGMQSARGIKAGLVFTEQPCGRTRGPDSVDRVFVFLLIKCNAAFPWEWETRGQRSSASSAGSSARG